MQAMRAPGYTPHPLVRLFHMRRMTEASGMDWLQSEGHISDNCIWAADVAAVDVQRVELLFKERWSPEK